MMNTIVWIVAWIAVMTGGGLAHSQEYPFDVVDYGNSTTTTTSLVMATPSTPGKPGTPGVAPYLMMPDPQHILQMQQIWQQNQHMQQQQMQQRRQACWKRHMMERVQHVMSNLEHKHQEELWQQEREMWKHRVEERPHGTIEIHNRRIYYPPSQVVPGQAQQPQTQTVHEVKHQFIPFRPADQTPGTPQTFLPGYGMASATDNIQYAPTLMAPQFQQPHFQPQQQFQPPPPLQPPIQPPPAIATIQTCPLPDTNDPQMLEQGLALLELLRTVGQDRTHALFAQLYPTTSQAIIDDFQRWRYTVLDPWVNNILQPGMHTDQPIGCPPFTDSALHAAWLLAFLREQYGFERGQQLVHRLFGMRGVEQLIAAEAWKQNVLGPWMENIHPQQDMRRQLHRSWAEQRAYRVQLREEHSQLMRMRRFYDDWMRHEEELMKRREYRQFMSIVLGNRFHRFLDRNHSPYYLFLSREMRRWIYRQHRHAMMEARHHRHLWRLKNDPAYYRRHHYIRGVFPVLHSILTSRKSYWRWHHRLHRRVYRAWRWRRMLNRLRRYYPHHHIPFRLLNRSYLCYVKWARRLSPFDLRNPLNPFNPYFGFGAPQSRCFRRWIRSMRGLPRWYWKAHPMRFRLPRGISRWPRFWWKLPRYRQRPWYLRAPWKFDPRFNPYWPYFRRPRWPRGRWPMWRMPSWRRPRFRWPYYRFNPFRFPRFRNPFRWPYYRFSWPFRRPRWNPFRWPWWVPRFPRFRLPWWLRWLRPRDPYYYD